ncbi:MAG: hypothetical protein E6I84_16095 [Chloroflexi bacterium]|nr:MAG: hypothetical protein E6I84_16095 [Chloroflexota bacterium]
MLVTDPARASHDNCLRCVPRSDRQVVPNSPEVHRSSRQVSPRLQVDDFGRAARLFDTPFSLKLAGQLQTVLDNLFDRSERR